MGGALFRLEAVDTDVAVDTLPFTNDNPRMARFRYQHAGVDTVFDVFPSHFRLYSRYMFLNVFTALQVIFGLFTVLLFNYLSTIRYHYAPRLDNSTGMMIEHSSWVIAPIYLSSCVLGLSFVVFATLYIVYVNSEYCMEREQRRWMKENRARMQEVMPNPSSSSSFAHTSSIPQNYRKESIGCRLRRIGVRWISCTRPYYAFHTRYLPDFDYRHALQEKYGEASARRNPQKRIFFCACPFVVLLTILDFITIDELRFTARSVSLLQGVVVFLGVLYIFNIVRYVILNGTWFGSVCYQGMTNVISR